MEVQRCTKCKKELSEKDKFCPHCGTKVSVAHDATTSSATKNICSSCGIPNTSDAKFCSGCGSSLLNVPAHEVRSPRVVESAKQQQKKSTPKQKTKKDSYQPIVIAVFLILIVSVVVFEFRNAPESSTAPAAQVPATMLQNNGESLARINELEKAIEANPSNAEALLELANRLQDAKFLPRAVEAYKKYLSLKPKDADARVDMAICFYESGDVRTATKEIETVLAQQPKHQMAMFNLGIMYLSQQDVEKSNQWLQQCIAIDSQSEAGKRAQQLLSQHSQTKKTE